MDRKQASAPIYGSASAIAITAPARQVMLAAASVAAPLEACGLLFGSADCIEVAVVARNVATAPRHRFDIDPAALAAAQRRGRAGAQRLIGCWHSHPGGSPLPSALDRAGVHDLGWLWLIVANGAVRAFRPTADAFAEVALRPAGQ